MKIGNRIEIKILEIYHLKRENYHSVGVDEGRKAMIDDVGDWFLKLKLRLLIQFDEHVDGDSETTTVRGKIKISILTLQRITSTIPYHN